VQPCSAAQNASSHAPTRRDTLPHTPSHGMACFLTRRGACAGTLEEKVFQRQLSKEGLSNVVNQSGKSAASLMSAEDLADLFTPDYDCLSSTYESMLEAAADVGDAAELPEEQRRAHVYRAQVCVPEPSRTFPNLLCPRASSEPLHALQIEQPSEDEVKDWAWHSSRTTVDDDVLRALSGDHVSFTFTLHVPGCDVQEASGLNSGPRTGGAFGGGASGRRCAWPRSVLGLVAGHLALRGIWPRCVLHVCKAEAASWPDVPVVLPAVDCQVPCSACAWNNEAGRSACHREVHTLRAAHVQDACCAGQGWEADLWPASPMRGVHLLAPLAYPVLCPGRQVRLLAFEGLPLLWHGARCTQQAQQHMLLLRIVPQQHASAPQQPHCAPQTLLQRRHLLPGCWQRGNRAKTAPVHPVPTQRRQKLQPGRRTAQREQVCTVTHLLTESSPVFTSR
jgi:hypothetical protein